MPLAVLMLQLLIPDLRYVFPLANPELAAKLCGRWLHLRIPNDQLVHVASPGSGPNLAMRGNSHEAGPVASATSSTWVHLRRMHESNRIMPYRKLGGTPLIATSSPTLPDCQEVQSKLLQAAPVPLRKKVVNRGLALAGHTNLGSTASSQVAGFLGPLSTNRGFYPPHSTSPVNSRSALTPTNLLFQLVQVRTLEPGIGIVEALSGGCVTTMCLNIPGRVSWIIRPTTTSSDPTPLVL
ncbi:hypothetical protein SAMN05444166_8148 [Singulisphaera sp. GP187]|nr:hypothetical protein SAMN05444166_8148 [Singulisphaera sp. GP187]